MWHLYIISFICAYLSTGFSKEPLVSHIIQSAIQNVDYIFCIDGGGSKTTLHVINSKGEEQKLSFEGHDLSFITGPAGNINAVGKEGINHAFHALFDGLEIDSTPLHEINKCCAVIAGMAGLGSESNRETILNLLNDFGFQRNHIVTLTDASLALEITKDKGIVLIAGTGTIAFGRDGEKIQRVGGFGRLIGDEGSGYYIGIKAIKMALEHELGYGRETVLTNAIKKHFKMEKVFDLIAPLHSGAISPDNIASISKIVFDEANCGDKRANEIIMHAAKDLGILLNNLLSQLNANTEYDVFLIGGIFRSENEKNFIRQIKETEALVLQMKQRNQNIKFHNIANQPIALLATLANL